MRAERLVQREWAWRRRRYFHRRELGVVGMIVGMKQMEFDAFYIEQRGFCIELGADVLIGVFFLQKIKFKIYSIYSAELVYASSHR